MKQKIRCFYCVLTLFFSILCFGQNIDLYEQFNGRYDFTFIGNTLNPAENNGTTDCTIFTTATATLNLNPNDSVTKAYLYWAGSGTGDFEVQLNTIPITAERTFSVLKNGLDYFGAFADVTTLVQNSGNGIYTFAELDLNAAINSLTYCNIRTNFGGWAMIIVYENPDLTLNQLNIYDGLQGLQGSFANPEIINITLNSLNVIDDVGSKIGFIAWEGDSALAIKESLKMNGTALTNDLNPLTNAFNGTNSITGATDLYNMDLDVYDTEDNIAIDDQTALIELSSGQDFVMINAIVSKLNSQLPDATIAIDALERACNSRFITVDYTVFNTNSTNALPSNVPIAVFANSTLLDIVFTFSEIAIGGSESNTVVLEIPIEIPIDFELLFVVDQNDSGVGVIKEISENNNTDTLPISLFVSPGFNNLENLESCNEGLGKGTFNFANYEEAVKVEPNHTATFFNSLDDANDNNNRLFNLSNFVALATPKTIYVRIEDENGCFTTTSFDLITKNCPPQIYNLVATNSDNFYDTFLIYGLRDIFLNFKLSIYNRWGVLIWTGNNNTPDWDGKSSNGNTIGDNTLPDGTYFYVLELNDPNYQNAMTGFLELTK